MLIEALQEQEVHTTGLVAFQRKSIVGSNWNPTGLVGHHT